MTLQEERHKALKELRMLVRRGINNEETERCIAHLRAAQTDEEIISAFAIVDEVVQLQFQDLCEEAFAFVRKARQA